MVIKIASLSLLVIVTSVRVSLSENIDLSCETTISNGVLEGTTLKSRSGQVFCAFLGIPFAKAPIGDLRFLSPKSLDKWNEKKKATKEGPICLQRGGIGSEDCLYLNVFTHSTTITKSFTVMVYIHGGGFYIGSSTLTALGPEYFMDKEIVLVTLQYRLGVFGFLTTGDEVIAGNMGLKDQVRALQWVQENIRAFGGDPKKVTIFGNSAGGSSVHLHMQAPASKDLFQRAISQSGTSFSGFALIRRTAGKKVTDRLMLSLNCSLLDSAVSIKCLQKKSSSDLLKAYDDILKSGYDFNKVLLRPTNEVDHDGAFLTSPPDQAVTNKPWLVGVNKHEAIYAFKLSKLNETIHFVKTEFSKFCPKILFLDDEKYSNLDEALMLIHNFYFKNSSNTEEIIQATEKMLTDALFIWPTEQGIRKHSDSLYHYLYDHRSEHSNVEIYGSILGYGVSHTDELLELFSQTYFPTLNEQDAKISKVMINLWVNFATTGNPTPSPVSSNPQIEEVADFIWEASNNTYPKYLHIQTNSLSMKNKMNAERIEFWQRLYQSLKQNHSSD